MVTLPEEKNGQQGSNRKGSVVGPRTSRKSGFERQLRRFETMKKIKMDEESLARVQGFIRGFIWRKNRRDRFEKLKSAKTSQISGILRVFSHSNVDRRYEAYCSLLESIAANLTVQDIINQTIQPETLQEIYSDLFSPDRRLRNASARFLAEIAHNHMGNQRLLTTLNGITVGQYRIFAVSSDFQSKYNDWCKVHGLEGTYEGLVRYLEGIVSAASKYYSTTRTVQINRCKTSLETRDSLFTYPQISKYDECDPFIHLVGVRLVRPNPPKLVEPDIGLLSELKQVFCEAITAHEPEAELFDALVPSVPLYTLLLSIQRSRPAMSPQLNAFFGDIKTTFDICGIPIELMGEEPPTTLSEKLICETAKLGVNVLWQGVAEKYAHYIVEQGVVSDLGLGPLQALREIFWATEVFNGPEHRTADIIAKGRFVLRVDLINRLLKETDENPLITPGFLWSVLGLLVKEDYEYCKELSGHTYAPTHSLGVRSLCQGLSVGGIDLDVVRSRFGEGSMSWDWISWIEFLCICRVHLCPESSTKAGYKLRPEKEESTQLWAPSVVGHSARRVKILQKMLRKLNHIQDISPDQIIKRDLLEKELSVLSRTIAEIDPNLTPVYVGFGGRKVSGSQEAVVQSQRKEEEERDNSEEQLNANSGCDISIDSAVQQPTRRTSAHEIAQERFISFSKKHRARVQNIAMENQRREMETRMLQEKAHLRWANDAQVRKQEALKRLHQASHQQKRKFIAKEQSLREKAALEQKTEDPPIITEYDNHWKCSEVDDIDVRQRILEFDKLVQVRNQAAISGAKIPSRANNHSERHSSENRIIKLAQHSVPIWTLCNENQKPRSQLTPRPKRPQSQGSGKVLPGRKGSPRKLASKNDAYTKIGGYLFRASDVEKITTKRFTIEEIKTYCNSFGNPNMNVRFSSIVAQHLYSKKMVEIVMGTDISVLKDDMYEILADLQTDTVSRAIYNSDQQEGQILKAAKDRRGATSFQRYELTKAETEITTNVINAQPKRRVAGTTLRTSKRTSAKIA